MILETAATYKRKVLLLALLGFSVSNTYFLMKTVTKQDASRFVAFLSVFGIVYLLLRKNLNFPYSFFTFLVPIVYIFLREPLERESNSFTCDETANVLDNSAQCKTSGTNETSKNTSLLLLFCLLAALGLVLLLLAKP
jgi:hypothetical protein